MTLGGDSWTHYTSCAGRGSICEHSVLKFEPLASNPDSKSATATMHQHPRPSPATASPANSPRTNPMRTNNPREELAPGSRASSGRGTPSEQGIGLGEGADTILRDPESATQGKDSVAKLNQVIQVRYRDLLNTRRKKTWSNF